MGQPVGFLKLIKLLLSSEELRLNKNLVQTAMGMDEGSLLKLVEDINSYTDLIDTTQDSLILKEKVDLLDDMSIFKRVAGSGRIAILESVDSTNSFMLKNSSMLANGDVVMAELQESGRGSRGGRWHSGIGRQLTLSLCYIFDSFEKLQGLSVGIGVATAISIEKFGFENVLLKWPNDVYMDNLKVGGILIETIPYKGKVKAIIGVGINVYPQNFGKLTRDYASVFAERPQNFRRNDMAAALINNIKHTCENFNQGKKKMTIEAFKARDQLLGKMIRVENVQGIFDGRAAGVDINGALLLAQENQTISISSGHISYLDV